MIYQSVSIRNVIARVIRNTRVQDSSYLIDMPEWIAEAVGYMKTRFVYKPVFEDVTIYFHKGKLPCNLIYIESVEYCGRRLPQSRTAKNYKTGHNLRADEDIPVVSTMVPVVTEAGTVRWENSFSTDSAASCNALCLHTGESYDIELGFINTTFPDGGVRIHYTAQPVDELGYLLIPDNENYKQAIYYYVRAMMIGCGYIDNVYKEDVLQARFELHAGRAIGEINYPSLDSMETKVAMLTRMIPQANYFQNFDKTTPEGNYG